jgi:transcriptional regulator with XRE-family HTH domain
MITEREDVPIPAHLVEQIKGARIKARLSQDELAALASISRRPIYLLESGRGAIRVDTLIKILDALGLVLSIQPKGPSL